MNLKKPKLLFVNHTAKLGGPSHSLLLLLQYLRQDYEVSVIVPDNGPLRELLDARGIPNHAFSLRYRTIPQLSRFLLWQGIDLVYGNNFSRSAWIACLAARIVGKPFVWHMREIFSASKVKNKRIYTRPRWATAIIAVSDASANSVRDFVPNVPIHTVYNGLDLNQIESEQTSARQFIRNELNIAEDSVLVTNVGAVCDRKNQAQALAALLPVAQQNPSVHTVFVGKFHEPEYVKTLQSKADEGGVAAQFHWLGFRKDALRLLRGSDIMVHTPRWDPHPRVVLEAMAAELPVAATAVDGVAETVVTDQTGILVPRSATMELSYAIDRLAADPKLRKRYGTAGREKVQQHFTAKQTAQNVKRIISDILKK